MPQHSFAPIAWYLAAQTSTIGSDELVSRSFESPEGDIVEIETVHPVPPASFVPLAETSTPRFALSPEDIPNVEDLVIEDDKPVDNLFVEREYRLLTEPLYISWRSPRGNFLAVANVGLFFAFREPPLVPDVMLSLDVPASRDLMKKENRSYFLWVVGKPPDVVIEIVSDLRGGEETDKMIAYARLGITYYVIFDPFNRLHHGLLRAFALRDGVYQPIEPLWFEHVCLGLTFWEGEYLGEQGRWLRWCDRGGVVLPTGQERAEQEKQRAEQYAAKLRALGINPDA
jgi:Uma2 family endonuclease